MRILPWCLYLPHAFRGAILDNNLPPADFILYHKVPILDVLSVLGAGELSICCHQDGGFIIPHDSILLDFVTLSLEKI